MTRRSTASGAALAGLLLLAATAAAHATCPATPKGYDVFDRKEFFRTSGPERRLQDDGLYLLAGAQPGLWPTSETFRNASICAQFELPKQMSVTDGIGVTFWQTDAKNFTAAIVFSNGYVGLEHVVNGTYTMVYSAASPDIVQPTPNPGSGYDSNTLEAFVTGNRVQLFLNDLRVATWDGTAPDTPWTAGLFAYSQSTPFDAHFFSARIIKLH